MRLAFAAIWAVNAATLAGQVLVDPERLPSLLKYFDARKSTTLLHCEVDPVPAQLNFSLRFQTGYIVRVPANQFLGAGRRVRTLIKVIPENGSGPAYLTSFNRFTNTPRNKRKVELMGMYSVGEGRYTVDWMLADDSGGVCRKSWRVEARLDVSERGLNLGLAAGAVAETTFRRWSPREQGADAQLGRLTIFLHAAPLVPNTMRLRPQDRILLLGSLSSLLESLPARRVRLVVFNLDQQKELVREDEFKPEAFPRIAQALSDLQLQLIDYRVLQNQSGPINVMTTLVNEELSAEQPSDAVIFLGPPSRSFENLPASALAERRGATPRFFYFQYRTFWRRAAELPDSIARAMNRLKGRTMQIHTPADFAKAIRQTQAQLGTDPIANPSRAAIGNQ